MKKLNLIYRNPTTQRRTRGVSSARTSKTPPAATTSNKRADKTEEKNADLPSPLGHPAKTVMAGLSAVLCTATCAAAQVAEMPVQQLEEEVESIGKDKVVLKEAEYQKMNIKM